MVKPRVEQTAERLLEYIIKNNMEIGERLPNEYTLASALGVGRSTVREAVKILTGQTILEVRQGSGTYILNKKGASEDPFGFSLVKDRIKLMTDLFELRYLLEPRIAERAVQFATDEDIQLLEEVVEGMEKSVASKDGKHPEWDAQFHVLLVKMSGNLAMATLVPVINDSIRLMNEHYESHQMIESSLKAHRNILFGLKNRHAIAAHDSMLAHILEERLTVLSDWAERKLPTSGLKK